MGSLGGGCGHGHPLHRLVALRGRPEPPGQDLGSASVSLRARMPRRESSVSSCQHKKKGKANVEHALIRDWNDKIVLGMS